MSNTEVAHSWKITVYSTTNIGYCLLYKLNGNKGDQKNLYQKHGSSPSKEPVAGRANCMQLMLLVQYEVCFGLNVQGKYHNMAKVSKLI